MLDLDAIRRDNPLTDVAAKLVALKLAGKELIGCCPFHADRSPSFTIFDGGRRFHCFGCGVSGDVLDFVQRVYGVTLPEAARMLGTGDVPRVELSPVAPADSLDRTAEARAIWEKAVQAAGTLAETYLAARGILPPFPSDVGFAQLSLGSLAAMPCLVAAVRNVGGDVTGVQRVFLAADGRGKADLAKPKLSLGVVKRGAIRLGDLDGSGRLTVCEGPEDGLSLLAMLGGSVWVAAGASFLPAMQFPPGVHSIVIGADNDSAGREGADKAAHAFAARGLTVRIIRPLEGFKDFNDELRGAH